jgi:hypothetical protein
LVNLDRMSRLRAKAHPISLLARSDGGLIFRVPFS